MLPKSLSCAVRPKVPPVLLTDDEFLDGSDEPGVLGVGLDARSMRGGRSGTPELNSDLLNNIQTILTTHFVQRQLVEFHTTAVHQSAY